MAPTFRVTGTFRMAPKVWQKFTKEVVAESQELAIEKVYSLLGSNHKCKRIHIKIEGVEEIENGAKGA